MRITVGSQGPKVTQTERVEVVVETKPKLRMVSFHSVSTRIFEPAPKLSIGRGQRPRTRKLDSIPAEKMIGDSCIRLEAPWFHASEPRDPMSKTSVHGCVRWSSLQDKGDGRPLKVEIKWARAFDADTGEFVSDVPLKFGGSYPGAASTGKTVDDVAYQHQSTFDRSFELGFGEPRRVFVVTKVSINNAPAELFRSPPSMVSYEKIL